MKSIQKNKFLSKNVILFLFALSSSFSGFLGCSSKYDSNPATVKFSWWGNDERAEYTLKGIEKFEAENPSIKIEPVYDSWSAYEKYFSQSFEKGDSADVMQINFDWLDQFSPDGKNFYDLNALSEYIDLYNFTMNDLSYGTICGKLNAVPVAFNTAIPVYDLTFFEQNSLKIPATWDELFSLGKILKQKDMYVFTMSNRHILFLAIAWFEQTFSKKVFSPNGELNLNEEELGKIFLFVKRLFKENVIYSPTKGIQIKALREKKIVGAVLWSNEISLFINELESLGRKTVLGNFITTPDSRESGWYLKPASMYAIKKDTKNPVEAAKFLNYLLNSQEFALLQKNEKGVPAGNQSLTALMKNNLLESMQYSALMKIRFNRSSINPMLPVMEDNSVIKSFSENAFAFTLDKKTLAESVKDFKNFQ